MMTNDGVILLNKRYDDIIFADIYEESIIDGKTNLGLYFALRDSYYETIRSAIRKNRISKEEIIATCDKEPEIKHPENKAHAAACAKYYLHLFGIEDKDMPEWIDKTPPCKHITPYIINAHYLKRAISTCPDEFKEKNILVCSHDFVIV